MQQGRLTPEACRGFCQELPEAGEILLIRDFQAFAEQMSGRPQDPLRRVLEEVRESILKGALLAFPGILRRLSVGQALDTGSLRPGEGRGRLVERLAEYLEAVARMCPEGDARGQEVRRLAGELKALTSQSI